MPRPEQPSQRTSVGVATSCLIVTALLGLAQAWLMRDKISPDAMSYLDLGDACWQGDWPRLANGHWSPLFPCIVGAATQTLRLSPLAEFRVAHGVAFFVYLLALGAFTFLLNEVSFLRRNDRGRKNRDEDLLPDWAWTVLAYAFFALTSLTMMSIEVGPDMLMSACVYAGLALLLRGFGRSNSLACGVFGLVLGVGYLAKAPFFPVAGLFLAMAVLIGRKGSALVGRLALAVAVFAIVGLPWVVNLQRKTGRLTFGDSARLNYAWHVNGVRPFVHWQGDSDRFGQPLHPTRLILRKPATFEFGHPIRATYAPWYDPSYWYEGVRPHFVWSDQLHAFGRSARAWFDILCERQWVLALMVAILIHRRGRWRATWRGWIERYDLLVPAVAACVMYSAVLVEPRYVAPFIAIFWLAIISGVRLGVGRPVKRATNGLVAGFLLVTALATIQQLAISRHSGRSASWHRDAASALHELGLNRGDGVAVIGDSLRAYWARLAGLRIIAEIPSKGPSGEIAAGDTESFWHGDETVQTRALRVLVGTGARVVVADQRPTGPLGDLWRPLGIAPYHAYYVLATSVADKLAPAPTTTSK